MSILRKNSALEQSLRPPPLPEMPFLQSDPGKSFWNWAKLNIKVVIGATVLHIFGLDGVLWNLVCLGVIGFAIYTLRRTLKE